jgi:hypothetical protein
MTPTASQLNIFIMVSVCSKKRGTEPNPSPLPNSIPKSNIALAETVEEWKQTQNGKRKTHNVAALFEDSLGLREKKNGEKKSGGGWNWRGLLWAEGRRGKDE